MHASQQAWADRLSLLCFIVLCTGPALFCPALPCPAAPHPLAQATHPHCSTSRNLLGGTWYQCPTCAQGSVQQASGTESEMDSQQCGGEPCACLLHRQRNTLSARRRAQGTAGKQSAAGRAHLEQQAGEGVEAGVVVSLPAGTPHAQERQILCAEGHGDRMQAKQAAKTERWHPIR